MSKIYSIKGVANSLEREKAHHESQIQALEQAGHTVIQVGNSVDGFALPQIYNTFQTYGRPDLIIVDCHGHAEENKHVLSNRRGERISSEDFYKCLAESSAQRPLDILMISCHSENGHHNGDLPSGSTVIDLSNFTFGLVDYHDSAQGMPRGRFNDLTYSPLATAFAIKDDGNRPFAERLFLNILSEGYNSSIPYFPKLTSRVSDLWYLATQELKIPTGENSQLRKEATPFLAEYFSDKTLSEAFDAIKWFQSWRYELRRSRGGNHAYHGQPMELKIDAYALANQARQHNLFGAICAIAYAAGLKHYKNCVLPFTASGLDVTLPQYPAKRNKGKTPDVQSPSDELKPA